LNDLALLLTLSPSALANLNPEPTHVPPQRKAKDLVNTFTPEAPVADSQLLVKAYVRDMKDVLAIDSKESDKMGERIDSLRERGEELRDALGNVVV